MPLLLSLALIAFIATVCPPIAAAALVLEEVIVTARKREESLQETPVAVSVLSGDALVEAGLRDITELAYVVPNLDLNTGGGGGAASPSIRGIGARNNGANFDSGVAIYLDGVYLSRVDGALLDSVDIQNVQVVRGPQGTLFGKNATGGALLYSTNKPTDVFEGHAQVDVGDYNRLDGRLTVNQPLIEDTLYSRFSVFSSNRDGFVKDAVTGNDFGDVDRWGGQVQLRLLGGDSLVFDLDARYSKTDQTTNGYECEQATGVTGAGWLSGLQDDNIVIPSTGKSVLEHCADSNQLDKDEIYTPFSDELPPRYESETSSVAATIDWDINEVMGLKSITAWRNIEAGEANDLYGLAIPFQTRTNFGRVITRNRNTDWYSQELQLNGTAFQDRLDYVVGVFASEEETDDGNAAGVAGPSFNTLNVPTYANYLADGTELLTENTSYAAFGQLDWSISRVWNLTLGLRYTWEERKLQRNTFTPDIADLSIGAPATSVIASIYNFPDGAASFNPAHRYLPLDSQKTKVDNDDWNPMASIQYLFEGGDVIEGGSAYFTVATGFVSGGISESVNFITGELVQYEPEEVINYEVGLKLDAFQSTLRLNTALFYSDYKDRQLIGIGVNPDNGTIAAVTTNAGEASIAGLEVEALWLPVPNLQVTLNLAFNKGDIDEFDDTTVAVTGELPEQDCSTATLGPATTVDGCSVDRSGEDLPRLPKQTYYLAVKYLWETDYGSFSPRAEVSYKKDINNCIDYLSCQWRGGNGLEFDYYALNARLTWRSPREDIRVTVYGNNLTDNQSPEGGNPLLGTTETVATLWSAPTTYGIELAYTW